MGELEPITVVLTSVGTEQQAVEISEELITRRLATCINIIPCLRSIYRWKGKVCEDTEYLLLVKTPERLFEEVSAAIREFHSYELPEILALPVHAAEANFQRWVLEMVETPKRKGTSSVGAPDPDGS
jgi:periplasmic divalent cation tolerance protein